MVRQLQKNLHTRIPGIIGGLVRLIRPLGSDGTQAAKAIVKLALEYDSRDINGKFFKFTKSIPVPALYTDERVREKLWKISERLTGL